MNVRDNYLFSWYIQLQKDLIAVDIIQIQFQICNHQWTDI